MSLPREFQFSQGSLQDFEDCRRRFQLRHLHQLAWPAVEADPIQENERIRLLGERFHHLVHQRLIGVPPERLLRQVTADPILARWWENFNLNLAGLQLYPELTLTAPLGMVRLIAKYDLIAVTQDGQARIYDWKTYRKMPDRQWLARRLQTRVYPYLLTLAGKHLHPAGGFLPDRIEMVYWFANFPDEQVRFPYSGEQFQADQADLEEMVTVIDHLSETEFPKTSAIQRCNYCVYRSFCERGTTAGRLEEAGPESEAPAARDAALEAEVNLEQVAEVEY